MCAAANMSETAPSHMMLTPSANAMSHSPSCSAICAEWKALSQEHWGLIADEPLTGTFSPVCESHSYPKPGVKDSIHYATDRPHVSKLPLIREYYL